MPGATVCRSGRRRRRDGGGQREVVPVSSTKSSHLPARGCAADEGGCNTVPSDPLWLPSECDPRSTSAISNVEFSIPSGSSWRSCITSRYRLPSIASEITQVAQCHHCADVELLCLEATQRILDVPFRRFAVSGCSSRHRKVDRHPSRHYPGQPRIRYGGDGFQRFPQQLSALFTVSARDGHPARPISA